MKCPTCPESVLVMADRSGIEIDYCPTCRGVWLDRGELDKIIERSATAPAATPAAPTRILPADAGTPAPQPNYQPAAQPGNSKYHSKYHDPRGGQYPRKKKSSFLGELFDF
ncbi:MAG: zf-TFIIB domain-containing protein [Actinomycetota bacterium]|nr:zf-TFIIB domain-containing protein [Actinomycetota bacterium]